MIIINLITNTVAIGPVTTVLTRSVFTRTAIVGDTRMMKTLHVAKLGIVMIM